MAYYYKVNQDPAYVDLDAMITILTQECPQALMAQMNYYFGPGGIKFITDTLQEQVDNIKARQPSETPPFNGRC